MKRGYRNRTVAVVLLLTMAACSNGGSSGSDGGTDTGTDADTDTDTDTDSDSDIDTDSDSDIDTDTDVDSDTDTGTGPFECDAGPPEIDTSAYNVPPGCTVLAASPDVEITHDYALENDFLVWRDYISDCYAYAIFARQLSTGITHVVHYQPLPGHQDRPVVGGDYVYWHQQTDPGEWQSREILRIPIFGGEVTQLTEDDCADGNHVPGTSCFVHTRTCPLDEDNKNLMFTDLSDLSSTQIVEDAVSSPAPGITFDGVRWVAWVFEARLHVYDLLNPDTPEPVVPENWNQHWPTVHDGKVYVGTGLDGLEEQGFDLWTYDLETETGEWIDDALWDQLGPSVDGHIIVYLDTEELESNWFVNGNKSHVEIMDLETLEKRTITIVDDDYYNPNIATKYLAFGVYTGNDVVVLCDLEAGGFIDSEGHVCPEDLGCPEPDAGPDDGGVDGGK